jgi:membrane protease YdiL (CAAX protease family)
MVEPGIPPLSAPAVASRERRSARRLAPVRFLVFVCCLLAGAVFAQLIRQWTLRHVPLHFRDWIAVPLVIVLGAALIGLYILLVRSFERRKAAEARPDAVAATTGMVLGFGLFSSVFVLLWLMGIASWQGLSAHFDLIPAFAGSMLAAIGEELALRGGAFRILEDTFGTTAALVGSAALFGLLHALNPGATAVSTIAIALEAGVLLGSAYALTRNLWLPIGIHFGWNFTEGGVFGAVVSGFAGNKGIFSFTLAGPTLLSGGKFGPEASVVAVAVTLAAAVVLIVVTIRRGLWIPARARLWLD